MPFDKRKRLPVIQEPVVGRVCWLCEHVQFQLAQPGYSDLTPGSDFHLECGKGYWEFDAFEDGLDEFREQLEAAERCSDFEKRESIR